MMFYKKKTTTKKISNNKIFMLVACISASTASFLCLINYFVYAQTHPLANIVFLTTASVCPLGMTEFTNLVEDTDTYQKSRFVRISHNEGASTKGGATEMAFMPRQFVKKTGHARAGTDTKALRPCDVRSANNCLEIEYPENFVLRANEKYLPKFINMLPCKLQ